MEELRQRKENCVYGELFIAIKNNYINYANNIIKSNKDIIDKIDYEKVNIHYLDYYLDDVVSFLRFIVENDKNLDKKVTSQHIFSSICIFSSYAPINNYDKVLQTCKLFIEKGFCINKTDSDGRTAFSHVTINPRVPQTNIIKLLLELGANPNDTDFFGDTILHKIIRNFSLSPLSNYEIINLLLSAGTNPNIRNSNGDTPLLTCKNSLVLNLLLSHGANPNDKDRRNDTLLHKLIKGIFNIDYQMRTRMINSLLSYGANVNERDGNLCTPLSLCKDGFVRDILLTQGGHP